MSQSPSHLADGAKSPVMTRPLSLSLIKMAGWVSLSGWVASLAPLAQAAMVDLPELSPKVTQGGEDHAGPAETAPWLAQTPNLSPDQQDRLDELLRQGQARVNAKDYGAAISAYQQAAQIDPRHPRIFSGLAFLYLQQEKYPEAIDAYRQALTLAPNNLTFQYGLAHSFYRNGEGDEARAVYQTILSRHPR